MVEYKINVERFNEKFPLKARMFTESYVHDITRDINNGPWGNRYEAYWTILGKAFNRHEVLPKGIPILDDLFPPNIAVLDWFLEMGFSKDTVVADFPCGLGNLMYYLGWLFIHVWGYDKWTQIEQWRAEKFLDWFNCPEFLVDLPTIQAKPIDILCTISLPWEWVAQDVAPILEEAEYLLLDASYLSKSPIDGFEEVGRYPNLLVVYKKI